MAGVAAVNVTNVSEQAGRGVAAPKPVATVRDARSVSGEQRADAMARLAASVRDDTGVPAYSAVARETGITKQTLFRWWAARGVEEAAALTATADEARAEIRREAAKTHLGQRVAALDKLREELEGCLREGIDELKQSSAPVPEPSPNTKGKRPEPITLVDRARIIESCSRTIRNLQMIEAENAALLARDQGAEGEKKPDPNPEEAREGFVRLAAAYGLKIEGQPTTAANDDYDPETAAG